MLDEIARPMPRIQLFHQDAFPGGTASPSRARQAAHKGAVGNSGKGSALHRRTANIQNGQGTKQLAKAIDATLEQALHGLRCAVTPGKPGAAGDQNHLHIIVGDLGGDLGADLVQVVLEQCPRH